RSRPRSAVRRGSPRSPRGSAPCSSRGRAGGCPRSAGTTPTRRSPSSRPSLSTGHPFDDRRERLEQTFRERVVRDLPPFAALDERVADLIDAADECEWHLEPLFGRETEHRRKVAGG